MAENTAPFAAGVGVDSLADQLRRPAAILDPHTANWRTLCMSRKSKRMVAFQNGLVAVEPELPIPHVHYPGHYGAFFAFSENSQNTLYVCSCARSAIQNYLRFRSLDDHGDTDTERDCLLWKGRFPQRLVNEFAGQEKLTVDNIMDDMCFEENICHECNRVMPTYAYCVPMYGGPFKQSYGWYINKQSYEYGVEPISGRILNDVCPDEIFSATDIGRIEFLEAYRNLSDTDLILRAARDKVYQRHLRRISRVIENEVRAKFGFQRMGECWASETLLYQIVCELCPEDKVLRNYRPDCLENLELDIFIPRIKVGIEYQGIQHFKPIEHWGGRAALESVKKRDAKKRRLCLSNGITLIYFTHNEQLSKELVKAKLHGLTDRS